MPKNKFARDPNESKKTFIGFSHWKYYNKNSIKCFQSTLCIYDDKHTHTKKTISYTVTNTQNWILEIHNPRKHVNNEIMHDKLIFKHKCKIYANLWSS